MSKITVSSEELENSEAYKNPVAKILTEYYKGAHYIIVVKWEDKKLYSFGYSEIEWEDFFDLVDKIELTEVREFQRQVTCWESTETNLAFTEPIIKGAN